MVFFLLGSNSSIYTEIETQQPSAPSFSSRGESHETPYIRDPKTSKSNSFDNTSVKSKVSFDGGKFKVHGIQNVPLFTVLFLYYELIFVNTTDAKLWTYALDCIPINPDYHSAGDFINSVDGNSRNCHCVLDHDAFFQSSLKLSRSSSGICLIYIYLYNLN